MSLQGSKIPWTLLPVHSFLASVFWLGQLQRNVILLKLQSPANTDMVYNTTFSRWLRRTPLPRVELPSLHIVDFLRIMKRMACFGAVALASCQQLSTRPMRMPGKRSACYRHSPGTCLVITDPLQLTVWWASMGWFFFDMTGCNNNTSSCSSTTDRTAACVTGW